MCTLSFDGLSACGANDTTFINNNVARKGGAVVIGSGDGGTSRVEMHGCTFDNSTTGSAIEDDPQGEGGAISVAQGTTLVLDDCLLINNFSGKKVRSLILHLRKRLAKDLNRRGGMLMRTVAVMMLVVVAMMAMKMILIGCNV